jgi:hypothetical protein
MFAITGRSLLFKNIKTTIHRTITLPVLYGCETWSLTLREKQRLMVFENRVVRKLLGPRKDEIPAEWKRLHNEELNDLYSSPTIIRVIQSRIMRLATHVACMGEREVHTGFWWRNLRKRGHLEDPGVDGRIILKWILKKWNGGAGTGVVWLRIGTGGGFL